MGEVGSCPLQEKEQRMEREVISFLLKCSCYIVKQVLGFLFHPFLVLAFHSLFALPILQWVFLIDGGSHGQNIYHNSRNKA